MNYEVIDVLKVEGYQIKEYVYSLANLDQLRMREWEKENRDPTAWTATSCVL